MRKRFPTVLDVLSLVVALFVAGFCGEQFLWFDVITLNKQFTKHGLTERVGVREIYGLH
jgi:hypothetical protein